MNYSDILNNAIKEAKSYFTDEQELEVMQETDSDVNFEVGFYRGLLEAQSILKGVNNES